MDTLHKQFLAKLKLSGEDTLQWYDAPLESKEAERIRQRILRSKHHHVYRVYDVGKMEYHYVVAANMEEAKAAAEQWVDSLYSQRYRPTRAIMIILDMITGEAIPYHVDLWSMHKEDIL